MIIIFIVCGLINSDGLGDRIQARLPSFTMILAHLHLTFLIIKTVITDLITVLQMLLKGRVSKCRLYYNVSRLALRELKPLGLFLLGNWENSATLDSHHIYTVQTDRITYISTEPAS